VTFRGSIRAFVVDAELHEATEYTITYLMSKFHFNKRRLYDALCVLCAIGCCTRRSIDSVFWLGHSEITATFRKLQIDAGAHLPAPTLDAIIGSTDSVSISPLTGQFVLCFLTLRLSTLNIRHIGRYLSRRTLRHKSTLCKLYQIAHILEAAGILHRSEPSGHLTMVELFFTPVDIDFGPAANDYSVHSLLNQTKSAVDLVLRNRRDDFFAEAARAFEDSDESEVA
jgi:hypothetical protein